MSSHNIPYYTSYMQLCTSSKSYGSSHNIKLTALNIKHTVLRMHTQNVQFTLKIQNPLVFHIKLT